VDDGEDRGIRADAERERQDRGGRVARALAERPPSVAHVLEHGLEEHRAARVAGLLLRLVDAAELDERRAPGLRGREAAAQALLGLPVEVEGELLLELALLPLRAEEHAQAARDLAPHDLLLPSPPPGRGPRPRRSAPSSRSPRRAAGGRGASGCRSARGGCSRSCPTPPRSSPSPRAGGARDTGIPG